LLRARVPLRPGLRASLRLPPAWQRLREQAEPQEVWPREAWLGRGPPRPKGTRSRELEQTHDGLNA
jgi:hypothetical protein